MPQQLSESFLRKRSTEILAGKVEDATIFDEEKEKSIPRFKTSEVSFGKVLGKGGFCTVSTLDGIILKGEDKLKHQPSTDENDFFIGTRDREFICNNFIRNGKHRYALKKLSPDLFKNTDPQHFVCGVIDLALEVKFLSILRHSNIIKMRAIADIGSCTKDFFVMIDRLDFTLTEQIQVWKKQIPNGFGTANKEKREDIFAERLCVGYDICSALGYIHEKRIIYRDMKPANLGFDVRGDVKLFDFGLAVEMAESRRVKGTDTFLLTQDSGSPRYMAPEVYLGKPYNEKSDVYSFGLIFWQILELSQPFSSYDIKKMNSKVYKGKETPKLNAKWSDELKSILKNCWRRDFTERNSCGIINDHLRGEIGLYDDSKIDELDISNRSAISVKNMLKNST